MVHRKEVRNGVEECVTAESLEQSPQQVMDVMVATGTENTGVGMFCKDTMQTDLKRY